MIAHPVCQRSTKLLRVLRLGLRGVVGDTPRRVHLRSERKMRLPRPAADLLRLTCVTQSLLQAFKVADEPRPLPPHPAIHTVVDVMRPDIWKRKDLLNCWHLSQPAIPRVLNHKELALLDKGLYPFCHLRSQCIALLQKLDVSRPLQVWKA